MPEALSPWQTPTSTPGSWAGVKGMRTEEGSEDRGRRRRLQMLTSGSGRVRLVGRGNKKAPRPMRKERKRNVPLKSFSQD